MSIDKMLLPGIQAMIAQRMEPIFDEQQKEFERREKEFRERLARMAGEIAVQVASVVAFDSRTNTITIQLKVPL